MLAPLYPILDIGLLTARSLDLASIATAWHATGVTLVQYRNKQGSARDMLRDAARLREIFPANNKARLIFNDRVDLALLAGFDGVHVGQGDISAEDARRIVGATRWVGVSTNSAEQVIEADRRSCDYIAYGPIFPTASKANPDPTVGLAGLSAARALTAKPLVAIGGITRKNCRSVLDAGADSLAVISDLLPAGDMKGDLYGSARRIAEEFLLLVS
ncbi:MAG TPA: thiamine phosphate synthase [Acidobacteriaceae bacterium]|nr:thiamine phosphate synthase [Acidobacteriaceae bacterium]